MSTLEIVVNAVVDLIGTSGLIAKLSDEQKAIATDKGWTLI